MLGGFSKDKLVYDPDISPLSENDNFGSFVRSGASGAPITHHADFKPAGPSFDFVDADVTVGIDTIAEVAHGYRTGDKIQLSNAGGALPTPLAAATDYFIIRVDADNFKLATTLARAEAGTAIDITAAAGGGTHTVTGQIANIKALDVWQQSEHYEDSPHTSGHKGQFILGVRHDADTSMVDADGDYAPLQLDANGNLKVIADLDVDFDYVYNEDTSNGVGGNLGVYVLAVRQDTLAASTDATNDFADFKVNDRGGLWTIPVGTVDDDVADTEWPVKIGFRAYTGPLGAVASGDRVNAASDLYRRLYVNNGSNIAIEDTQVNVTDAAATPLPATSLGGRRTIMVQNLSGKEIYVGKTGVTSADGFVVGARATISLDLGPDVVLFARGSQTAAQDLRILELA
jgi:hypothetical protein